MTCRAFSRGVVSHKIITITNNLFLSSFFSTQVDRSNCCKLLPLNQKPLKNKLLNFLIGSHNLIDLCQVISWPATRRCMVTCRFKRKDKANFPKDVKIRGVFESRYRFVVFLVVIIRNRKESEKPSPVPFPRARQNNKKSSPRENIKRGEINSG